MHVSSLYGEYGIGSFGKEAREFIDFLAESGFSLWQTLPFCMPDECNSPYKSYSAFGANPYFIDLPTLYEKGYLTEEELLSAKQKTPYLCEYEKLKKERFPLISLAASRAAADKELCKRIDLFLAEHEQLLRAAEFLALREANAGTPWQTWTVKSADPDTLFAWKFIQYEFFTEWQAVKTYANSRGIKIIGDLPIYVALDSADVWANPDDFMLDSKGYPTNVAGVPPDYFSEDGQLWGNPLYNWRKMKDNGYSFWKSRMEYMLTLFDGVRIDHFRAFESFWSIPANAESAKAGRWALSYVTVPIEGTKRRQKHIRILGTFYPTFPEDHLPASQVCPLLILRLASISVLCYLSVGLHFPRNFRGMPHTDLGYVSHSLHREAAPKGGDYVDF